MTFEPFRHQRAALKLIRTRDDIPYVFLIGGFGCLDGGALIETDKGPMEMYKFDGGLVKTPIGFRNASQPIPSPSEIVQLEGDGFQIRCNGAHLVQQTNGQWISVSELLARQILKSLYTSPAWNDVSDVLHYLQTTQDSLYGYLACFHFGDAQFQKVEEGVLDETPLLEYAHEHNPVCYGDGQILQLCIHLVRFFYKLHASVLPERSDWSLSDELLHSMNLEGLLVSVYEALIAEFYRKLRARLAQVLQLSQYLTSPSVSSLSIGESTFQKLAYNTSLLDTYIIGDENKRIHVQNISFLYYGTTYRLHVDEAECYYANGILNHNCGKSTTDVMLLLMLISYYMNSPVPVTFGLIGVTIKLLSQTVLKDLRTALDNAGILYKDNTMKGQFSVGNITFIYLAMSNPEDIYAHNFCGAIIDEMDELPPDRVLEVVKAVQERCRVCCPAPLNREPFLFFSTTAQGLGGTYQLTEYCKKKGIKYAIVKGKTEYNTSLAKSQIELLRKLYTPEEARAYLDGEFVNLSTGRVYPEFNRKVHVHMSFDIKPGTPVYNERGEVIRYEGGDVIYAGQDFNSGYNACTIGIERNGVIYVIDAKHWDYVGDGARCLREMYPNNRIIIIPDANGKEIMSGFVEEFEKYNVEIWWNNVNPSITERIMGVNKAFRWSQLKVFEGLDDVTMCLETRDFDDSGKPRKGKGPKALDHWGDSLEYMFWHIIHQIKGYDQILAAIRAVHSPSVQKAA